MGDKDLENLIVGAVKAAFKDESCKIKCPIPEDAYKEISHVFGVIKDLGDGDIRAGVEIMRENHKFVAKLQKFNCTVSNWIAKTVIVTVVGTILTAIGLGVKALLGR